MAINRSVAGQLGMLALTLDVRSWGWPFLVIAGVGVAVRDRRTRFAAAWLGLAAAAYYAVFLCVILYNDDRYLPGGHPALVGPRDTFPVASILRDINPLIEIYERNP